MEVNFGMSGRIWGAGGEVEVSQLNFESPLPLMLGLVGTLGVSM